MDTTILHTNMATLGNYGRLSTTQINIQNELASLLSIDKKKFNGLQTNIDVFFNSNKINNSNSGKLMRKYLQNLLKDKEFTIENLILSLDELEINLEYGEIIYLLIKGGFSKSKKRLDIDDLKLFYNFLLGCGFNIHHKKSRTMNAKSLGVMIGEKYQIPGESKKLLSVSLSDIIKQEWEGLNLYPLETYNTVIKTLKNSFYTDNTQVDNIKIEKLLEILLSTYNSHPSITKNDIGFFKELKNYFYRKLQGRQDIEEKFYYLLKIFEGRGYKVEYSKLEINNKYGYEEIFDNNKINFTTQTDELGVNADKRIIEKPNPIDETVTNKLVLEDYKNNQIGLLDFLSNQNNIFFTKLINIISEVVKSNLQNAKISNNSKNLEKDIEIFIQAVNNISLLKSEDFENKLEKLLSSKLGKDFEYSSFAKFLELIEENTNILTSNIQVYEIFSEQLEYYEYKNEFYKVMQLLCPHIVNNSELSLDKGFTIGIFVNEILDLNENNESFKTTLRKKIVSISNNKTGFSIYKFIITVLENYGFNLNKANLPVIIEVKEIGGGETTVSKQTQDIVVVTGNEIVQQLGTTDSTGTHIETKDIVTGELNEGSDRSVQEKNITQLDIDYSKYEVYLDLLIRVCLFNNDKIKIQEGNNDYDSKVTGSYIQQGVAKEIQDESLSLGERIMKLFENKLGGKLNKQLAQQFIDKLSELVEINNQTSTQVIIDSGNKNIENKTQQLKEFKIADKTTLKHIWINHPKHTDFEHETLRFFGKLLNHTENEGKYKVEFLIRKEITEHGTIGNLFSLLLRIYKKQDIQDFEDLIKKFLEEEKFSDEFIEYIFECLKHNGYGLKYIKNDSNEKAKNNIYDFFQSTKLDNLQIMHLLSEIDSKLIKGTNGSAKPNENYTIDDMIDGLVNKTQRNKNLTLDQVIEKFIFEHFEGEIALNVSIEFIEMLKKAGIELDVMIQQNIIENYAEHIGKINWGVFCPQDLKNELIKTSIMINEKRNIGTNYKENEYKITEEYIIKALNKCCKLKGFTIEEKLELIMNKRSNGKRCRNSQWGDFIKGLEQLGLELKKEEKVIKAMQITKNDETKLVDIFSDNPVYQYGDKILTGFERIGREINLPIVLPSKKFSDKVTLGNLFTIMSSKDNRSHGFVPRLREFRKHFGHDIYLFTLEILQKYGFEIDLKKEKEMKF